MPGRVSRTLTEVELEFMLVIWELGEVTTDDVLTALDRQGRSLSDGSVRKILSILLRKGYLSRKKEGRGFVYWATVPERQAKRSMLVDLLKRAFDGSASLLVASLLDTREVRNADIEEIRRLIAEHKGEAGG
jgi:predicted transcriptional regulator